MTNRTMLWATALAEELARSGVRHACIAPGNRSGPLAFALSAQPMKLWSHIDERSAGFFALGLAKATRAPVALVCTSGTAAANFLPAVIEAWHARVPLVVLTADRPHDLRDTGANQAIRQPGLYGEHVRWAFDLPPPVVEARALRHVRVVACRAVAEARGPPAGPVHLNVPLAKPLEPTPAEADVPAGFAEQHPLALRGQPDGTAFVAAATAPRRPDAEVLAAAVAALRKPRGLIVAGPSEDPAFPAAAAALARATGFPLLADGLSGLRFGGGASVAGYEAIVQSGAAALRPDVVLRLGAAPTSDALLQWLERSAAPQVVVDELAWSDPTHRQGVRVAADPARACEALAGLVGPAGDSAWRATWQRLDAAVASADAASLREHFFEAAAVTTTLDALPEEGTLFVSNSLAVRDLDRFGRSGKRLRAWGNRGASGIDGITSTALGIRAASDGPVALVTGDLAFYHDLPGLLAVKRLGLPLTMVVVHNDGGRIFEQLPAARFEPPFEELFVTPHGLDFEHAARMFGAGFRRVEGPKALREELAAALASPRAEVVEVRFDPGQAQAARQRTREAAAAAVDAALRGLGLAG